MRPMRILITALLATGMAALGYAREPAGAAAQPASAFLDGHAAGSAVQQDEQKPKDTTETKPPKAEKQSEPAQQQKADKQDEPAKPSKADKRAESADQQKQTEPAKPPKPEKAQNQKDENQTQDRNVAKQEQKADQDQNRKAAKPDQRAGQGQQGAHGRIADKDYQAHFGQQHKFSARSVVTTTRIVPNQTQFVYTGYTFVFVDPWPVGWAMDDDCYIDYDDGGYFLIDLDHPGVQIALTIVG
jgi:outer membrane biosynthesis protein TonB